jgi:cellulose synthase operon protein C
LLDSAAAGRTGKLAAIRAETPLSVASVRAGSGGENAPALVRGRIASGQRAEAVDAAEAFLRTSPGSADALALAGDAHLANGGLARALELYRQAGAIRQTWPLVRRMVAAYRASGRADDAAALLARHLAGDPHNGEAAAELARVAMDRRDWTRAALLLDHAIDHGAGRDPAVWMLRSIAAGEMGDSELAFDAIVYAHVLQPMRRETAAMLAGERR